MSLPYSFCQSTNIYQFICHSANSSAITMESDKICDSIKFYLFLYRKKMTLAWKPVKRIHIQYIWNGRTCDIHVWVKPPHDTLVRTENCALKSINQSINQSINRSTDQSINQSINQSIDRSINHSFIYSLNQSITQSIETKNTLFSE